jgi:mono/diheme cytochrome c family protein
MNSMSRAAVTMTVAAILCAWSSTASAAEPAAGSEALFNRLGCVGCHGEGAAFHEEIKGAQGKPVDALARWIRDAPSIKPDTMMPSFARTLDQPQARALAEWVRERVATMP